MKWLGWACALFFAFAFFWSYIHPRTDVWATHTSAQNASAAAARDVQDELNYQLRQRASEVSKQIRKDGLTGAQVAIEEQLAPAQQAYSRAQQALQGTASIEHKPQEVSKSPRVPIQSFFVLDASVNSFQLDARELWRELPIIGRANAEIEIYADRSAVVCSAEHMGCAGPDGIAGVAGNDKDPTAAREFAAPNTWYYALVGRWGNNPPFQIGSHYRGTVPSEAAGEHLRVMANVQTRPDQLQADVGGHRILSITLR
jgi:hypothetical protein